MGSSILDRDEARADVFNRQLMASIDATYHRPHAVRDGNRRALAGMPLGLLAVLALTLLSATGAWARSAQTLVIEGTGDGHGVGMSQDGALGLAQHGYTYRQILAHYYTGTTLGSTPSSTIIKVLVGSKVKRVPIERYVRGVVSAEMSASWPLAALEAQAVASRTYALTADAGGSRFDVYSDTRSQVYRGVAAETSTTNAAVAATAGQIVTYAGKPAITYFFASSGGETEDVQNGFPGAEAEPWLVAVNDPYETSSSRWKIQLTFAAAGRSLAGLYKGSFRGIEVLKRGVSPRILSARVLGSSGSSVLDGPELAARLGLDSTWEYFSVLSHGVVRAEPDHSGQSKLLGPPSPGAALPATPEPEAADGGVLAAGPGTAAEASASGGTSAG